MKKEWEKPKLVILVKSRPEEVLTTGCKTNTSGSGPNNTHVHCNKPHPSGQEGRCNACHAQNSS